MTPRRNCVSVVLSNTVGHELVFRHYTNKVVVGKHHNKVNPDIKSIAQTDKKKKIA